MSNVRADGKMRARTIGRSLLMSTMVFPDGEDPTTSSNR